MTEFYGVDVSHHNVVDWANISKSSQFAICRATYGTSIDKRVQGHFGDSKAHGLITGLYHFFRPTISVQAQFDAFCSVARSVGYAPGDLIPWIDVEKDPVPDPGHEVNPTWDERVHELSDLFVKEFGNVGIYITKREWTFLGSPDWVLERPMWVAHYHGGPAPSAPSPAWTIWQHRVGVYDPRGVGGFFPGLGAIDQNRARELPLLASRSERVPTVSVRPPPSIDYGPIGIPDDLYDELSEQRRRDVLER